MKLTAEPSNEEQFLLRVLAQQTGATLGNRRLHAQEQATAQELSQVNDKAPCATRECVTVL